MLSTSARTRGVTLGHLRVRFVLTLWVEREPEARSRTGGAPDFERTAMQCYQSPADREPKAGPTITPVDSGVGLTQQPPAKAGGLV